MKAGASVIAKLTKFNFRPLDEVGSDKSFVLNSPTVRMTDLAVVPQISDDDAQLEQGTFNLQ